MRYLLDTHTFIWFSAYDNSLSSKAAKAIIDSSNECFLSVASLWEIAIKCNIGKLELKSDYHKILDFLHKNNIQILAIGFDHLQRLLHLELFHREPFDRIIISQAINEDMTIVTADKQFKNYPVKCVW